VGWRASASKLSAVSTVALAPWMRAASTSFFMANDVFMAGCYTGGWHELARYKGWYIASEAQIREIRDISYLILS
jgi:hypothetical protein